MKNTHDNFNHLVNQNFDLTAIAEDKSLIDLGAKRDENLREFANSDTMSLYATAFGTKSFSTNCF